MTTTMATSSQLQAAEKELQEGAERFQNLQRGESVCSAAYVLSVVEVGDTAVLFQRESNTKSALESTSPHKKDTK